MIPTPVELSDASVAFPADALEYMPAWTDIPDEFKTDSPWIDLATTWFSFGLDKRFSFQPATIEDQQIDPAMTWRQLRAIMGSFASKHEHKIATVAYLSSLWMESVIYGRPDCEEQDLRVLGEATLDEWLEFWRKE